jgi:DNA repair photolyase
MKVRICDRTLILRPCSVEGCVYQVDPYIGCEHRCCYCYALNQAQTDWTQEILIHQDIGGQLRQELAAVEPQPIYIGWSSDPYQPTEALYGQTRKVLEALAAAGCPACILTKSDLVTRDLDLLAAMPDSTAGVSLAFDKETVRRLFEPAALPTSRRIAALKTIKDAGVRTYVLIAPVMPFITDVKALIEMAAPYADSLWIYPLTMATEADRNWQNLRPVLARHFPDYLEAYRRIAFAGDDSY